MIVNDCFVISNCTRGRVYFWEIIDQNEKSGPYSIAIMEDEDLQTRTFGHEHTKPYSSYVYDNENDLFVACLPEKNLVVYRKKAKEFFFEYITGECAYTSLCLDTVNKVLYCGTSKGTVRVHLWPPVVNEESQKRYLISQQILELEQYEFAAHILPIDHLALTPNSKSLISISAGGMIMLLSIDPKDELLPVEGKSIIDDRGDDEENTQKYIETINDLFFIKQSTLKNQQRVIKSRQLEVARLKKKMKTDEENKHRENKAKILKIEKNFMEIAKQNEEMRTTFLKNSDIKITARQEEIERLKVKMMEEEERLDSHTHKIVEYERQRNSKLETEYIEFKRAKETEIVQVVDEQKGSLNQLQEGYEEKLDMLKTKHDQILRNAKVYGENFLNKIELEEAEHEKEIQMKIKHYEGIIRLETYENKKLERERDDLIDKNTKSKNSDVLKQKQFEKMVIQNTELLENKVKICISLLKKQEQLLEREQVVFSKDETIRNARDEQINLENFRFMLDQKIKSLTSNKTALVKEIDDREKILREMFNELIRQSQLNSGSYLAIETQLKKMDILQEQKKNVELKIYFWNSKMKEYHRALTSAISAGSSNSELAQIVNQLLEENKGLDVVHELRALNKSDLKKKLIKMGGDTGTNVHEELLNQNKWLLKKLNMLNVASQQIRDIRDENIEMGLNQNKKLIEECNKLKIENEMLERDQRTIEAIINESEQMNRKLKKERLKLKGSEEIRKQKQTLMQDILSQQEKTFKSTSSIKSSKKGGLKLPKIHK